MNAHYGRPRGVALPRNAAAGGAYRFLREGEYWTIAYEGSVFRVKDTKGLRCLAHLLLRPGQYCQAEELLATACIRSIVGGTDAERARVAVTKRIRAAIAKIAAHHRSLGHHLDTTVKTGNACAYLPDPDRPIVWAVAR